MTSITLQLDPQTEHLLRQNASRRGETLETYLRYLAEKEASGIAQIPDMLSQGLEWLTHREPEEVLAARQRILGASAPPRDLPPGKDVLDMVEGKWPGTETDAEVRKALDEIS